MNSTDRKISPSLQATLGAMERSERVREASDLRELLAHPGWEVLVRYVDVQARHVESKADAANPLHLAMEIGRNPAAAAARLAAAGGEARGLRQFEQLVFGAVRTADRLEQGGDVNNNTTEE